MSMKQSGAFNECVLHAFMTKATVLEKKVKVRGSRSWYEMKGLAKRNNCSETCKPYDLTIKGYEKG
jgi:hypothetical protein